MDKWTYRRAMPFLCTVTALLIGTLSLTAKMNQVFFFIWVCLIYLCIGGFYAMFPAYTSISFGNLYMTANYGWIFTNQFISSFVSAFFVNAFIGTLGNTGVTVCLAVMLLVAACLSGFGKKWDYHVGRRELQKTMGSATLPATVILPPEVAAAAAAKKIDILPAVTEEEEKPAEAAVAMPEAPKTEETPKVEEAPKAEEAVKTEEASKTEAAPSTTASN